MELKLSGTFGEKKMEDEEKIFRFRLREGEGLKIKFFAL